MMAMAYINSLGDADAQESKRAVSEMNNRLEYLNPVFMAANRIAPALHLGEGLPIT
jgi:hypothetical protein